MRSWRGVANPDVVLFVAEQDDVVVGYVYGRGRRANWRELREAAGFIHDVVVAPARERAASARQLIDAASAWCRERGMPRVLLWVAEQNAGAQRLFDRAGFRKNDD